MIHHIFGDYVITEIPNAFNNRVSFWISKQGFTVSFYCFSALSSDTKEKEYQLSHYRAYIALFDAKIGGITQ